MEIIRPDTDDLSAADLDDVDLTQIEDDPYVVIETDEAEHIVLTGTSDTEVKAKLKDFLAWAS